MITGEKILITGGAGFIGTRLAEFLIRHDNEVVVFDNFTRNALQYYMDTQQHDNVTVVEGDIRNLSQVKSSVQDATLVFHLAAIAGVSKYFRIPADVMEVNIIGTFNILEAIKDNKNIKAFFDFSTSESYGSNCFNAQEDGDVKMENLSEKRWTYATSKIASEKFGMCYYWQYGVPFIGIRPFNIYGPGQVGEGVLSCFLNNALNGKSLSVTGDGSQCRTYCYIDDFLHGIEKLLENMDKVLGKSFNIGTTNEIISVLSLAHLVKDVVQMDIPILFREHEGEDVMVRSPNIDRLMQLGYQPKVSLREGVQQTWNWYKEKHIVLD